MDRSQLLLVGASGLAAETVESFREAGTELPDGVLDDDPARWGQRVCGVPVLGGLDGLRGNDRARVLVCTGKGRARESLVERIVGLGVEVLFPVLIHPSVRIPASCQIGAGSIVLAGVVLTARVTLGEHVVIMPNVVLTHDDFLDDYATICAGVKLGGHVRIGRRVYIGMGASVRERTDVAADAVVGMGAAVVGDVCAGQTVIGVPARPLGVAGIEGSGP